MDIGVPGYNVVNSFLGITSPRLKTHRPPLEIQLISMEILNGDSQASECDSKAFFRHLTNLHLSFRFSVSTPTAWVSSCNDGG